MPDYKILITPATKVDANNQHVEIIRYKTAIDENGQPVTVEDIKDTVSISLLQAQNENLQKQIDILQSTIDSNQAIIDELAATFDSVVEPVVPPMEPPIRGGKGLIIKG